MSLAIAFKNLPLDFCEGVTARSKHRIVPPTHILVPEASGEYVTWCTCAPAMPSVPIPGRERRCRACVALLREYHEECGDD